MSIQFDPTVSLGAVLTFVGMAGSVFYFGTRLLGEAAQMRLKLDLIWEWFLVEHDPHHRIDPHQRPTPNGAQADH